MRADVRRTTSFLNFDTAGAVKLKFKCNATEAGDNPSGPKVISRLRRIPSTLFPLPFTVQDPGHNTKKDEDAATGRRCLVFAWILLLDF
jgi:hypothetical protein